ncbi:unnamed protein product [Rotaria sp. Silwood1]|nr:unnamed protein product [Rotaria sp. Silwood1]CAF4711615.1 unnamed protein product [Rotaria sp. Silwood1]
MRTTTTMHDNGAHESEPSQIRLRSKVVIGKVAKKATCKTRKLVRKNNRSKSTVNNTSARSVDCKSANKRFQVNTDKNSTMDSSIITPPTLLIDEDVICGDENNKNNAANLSDTRMELININKDKTNEPVYATLNDVDLTSLMHPPKINSNEVVTTLNAEQSPNDMSLDEEKIGQLLNEALSSTAIDVQIDSPVQKIKANGHQSRRFLHDCNASNSPSTQSIGQQLNPGVVRSTSLSTAKSPTVHYSRISSINRTQDSCSNSNVIYARSQAVHNSGTGATPIHLDNSKSTSRSSIIVNNHSPLNDNLHNQVISNQVKQNMMLLQALPEYRALQREVKLLKKKIKQWAHDYEILERKYEELQSNSFPRPSVDGYEFLIQLVDCISRIRRDDDPRTNAELALDLNLSLEQLIALEHEDPQRTALNILHAIYPTNKEKADLIGIRHMAAMHSDVLRTIFIFARRASPTAAFSMRQLRNTFGTAIRQARYRENLSNKNVLVLGEALMKTVTDNNSSINGATTCNNTVQYNVDQITSDLYVDSNSDSDDE